MNEIRNVKKTGETMTADMREAGLLQVPKMEVEKGRSSSVKAGVSKKNQSPFQDLDLHTQGKGDPNPVLVQNEEGVCAQDSCSQESAYTDSGAALLSQAALAATEGLVQGPEAASLSSGAAASTGSVGLSGAIPTWQWVAVGAGGAVAGAAALGSSKSGQDSTSSGQTIKGRVAVGQVLNAQSVVVDVYVDGVKQGSADVDAQGAYSLRLADTVQGVVVVRARDKDGAGGGDTDYMSETGKAQNLNVDFRAAGVIAKSDANVELNISHLTEFAVRMMDPSAESNYLSLSSSQVVAVNKSSAALWGIHVDPTQLSPVMAIDAAGNSKAADNYGKVLALFAGMDGVAGEVGGSLASVASHIQKGADGVSLSWKTGSDAVAMSSLLLKGLAQLKTIDALSAVPAEFVALDNNTPAILSASVSGADPAGAAKTGVLITGDKVLITLVTSEATVVGGHPGIQFVLNSSADIADAVVTARYLSGSGTTQLVFAYDIQQNDFLSRGRMKIKSTSLLMNAGDQVQDIASKAMQPTLPTLFTGLSVIEIEATQPDVPKIALATDSGASATDTVTSVGTVTVNGLISGGKWQYSLDNGTTWSEKADNSSNQVTLSQQGNISIVVRQSDALGNFSQSSSPLKFLLDTTAPAAVAFDVISQDNVVTVADKVSGLTITGTTTETTGASVLLRWGGVSKYAQVAADGHWSATLSPSQMAMVTSSHILTATAVDLAGNETVTTSPIRMGVGAAIDVVGANDLINNQNKIQGVSVSGVDIPGAAVTVDWNSDAANSKTVEADATTGRWAAFFSTAELPATDGKHVVSAYSSTDRQTSKRTVTIDTKIDNLSVGTVGQNNIIDLATAEAGVTISGKAEMGASVNVTLGTAKVKTAVANDLGDWSVQYALADLPADGSASLVVKAQDAAGNVKTLPTMGILIDTTPPKVPTIDDLNSGPTLNIVNAKQKTTGVTFTGTAGAGDAVKVTWESVVHTVRADINGMWSASFTTVEVPADKIGTVVQAVVVDAVGNASHAKDLLVDVRTVVTSPVIDAVGNSDVINKALADTGYITISGSALPGSSVHLVWGSYSQNLIADKDTGVWSDRVLSANIPQQSAAGTTKVVVTQTDAYNNSVQTERSVYVDTVLPDLPTLQTVSGDNRVGSSEIANGFTLKGNSSEAGLTINVKWGDKYSKDVVTADDGSWQALFFSDEIPFNDQLANGLSTTVEFFATDRSGNVGAKNKATVIVDTSAPAQPGLNTVGQVVGSTEVINAAAISAGVKLSGTGEAGATVQVVFGTNVKKGILVDSTGHWETVFDSASLPKTDGTYTVFVQQTDVAGNLSDDTSRDVLVARSAGSVSISSTIGGADKVINIAEKEAGVLVSGTAPANATVDITWGTLTKAVTANAAGYWSFTAQPGEMPSATTKLSAKSTDIYGNVSNTSELTPAMDLIAPGLVTLTGDAIAGDNHVTAAERTAGFTVSGTAEALSKISISWGGKSYDLISASVSGSWSKTFATADIPQNTTSAAFSVSATDAAGNAGQATLKLVTFDAVL